MYKKWAISPIHLEFAFLSIQFHKKSQKWFYRKKLAYLHTLVVQLIKSFSKEIRSKIQSLTPLVIAILPPRPKTKPPHEKRAPGMLIPR